MEEFVIEGGVPLNGEVTPSGNKNAALPLLAACLLTDGLKPIATFRLENSEEMALAKDLLSPEGIKRLMGRDGQRCSMGVGCDEYGVCYAEAHGRPEMCPQQEPTNG